MTESLRQSSVQSGESDGEPHALIPERMNHSFMFSPVLLVATRGKLKINIGTLSRKDKVYSPKIDQGWDPRTRFRPKSHLILNYVIISMVANLAPSRPILSRYPSGSMSVHLTFSCPIKR